MSHCTVYAITNQKGGVGKTTTTVNLGIGLAKAGKKVLLIDFDPQASLTASLGYKQPDELDDTISTVLEHSISDKPMARDYAILHHDEGVDFIPSNIELSELEVRLINTMSREQALREYLDCVKENYDYILIDCMPSLGVITINALVAADKVIIPTQPNYLSAIELSPEGTGYRAKTRFAKFYNLPELMAMFKETADIQTADMLKLPVPEAHYHSVVLKPSETQAKMVHDLSERAERVRNKMVDSTVDNM